MSNLSDSATLPRTAPAVNQEPISIGASTRGPDGCRRGTLLRGAVPVGTWSVWPGGPVAITVDGLHAWSVQVDGPRGLLQRHGYEVAGGAIVNWTRMTIGVPTAGETVLAYWERDGRCEPAVRYDYPSGDDVWRRSGRSLGDVREWPDEPPTHWCYLELPT